MIVNTHSPAVFQEVPDDSVVFVKTVETIDAWKHLFKEARPQYLSNTWRAKGGSESDCVARGDLLAYLNPVLPKSTDEVAAVTERRVVDRRDVMQLLLFPGAGGGAVADRESGVE